MPEIKRQAQTGARTVTSNKVPTGKKIGILSRARPMVISPHIKMLLYGASGTGKTRVWSSWEPPILSLVCSGMSKPGEGLSISDERLEGIEVLEITSTEEVIEVGQALAKRSPYKTVVLDHASSLQDYTIAKITGKKPVSSKERSWGMATQAQWGTCNRQCIEACRVLLDADCHTIIIAQERDFSKKSEDESESGDDDFEFPTVNAGLTAGFAGWLVSTCNYVGQTFKRPQMKVELVEVDGEDPQEIEVATKKFEYCMRIGAHRKVTTKFRVKEGIELPDSIVNPTFDNVRAVLAGKYKPPKLVKK